QLRVAEARAGSSERLRRDRLGHAGHPRRPAGAEAEVVLPGEPAAPTDPAREQRLRQLIRPRIVLLRDEVVQLSEVLERVELEAEPRKGAVPGAVRVVDDVRAGLLVPVGGEPAGVEAEHPEQRATARRVVALPGPGHLVDDRGEVLVAA